MTERQQTRKAEKYFDIVPMADIAADGVCIPYDPSKSKCLTKRSKVKYSTAST
jgi:hypothetical protein